MNKATVGLVRRRAAGRCEYCGMPECQSPIKFHIEHVIARQHKGSNAADNLALACGFCNLHKGPNLSGIDPLTGTITALFHPRRQLWAEHFLWNGPIVEGISDHGRATVSVLSMNDRMQIGLRRTLMEAGNIIPPS